MREFLPVRLLGLSEWQYDPEKCELSVVMVTIVSGKKVPGSIPIVSLHLSLLSGIHCQLRLANQFLAKALIP